MLHSSLHLYSIVTLSVMPAGLQEIGDITTRLAALRTELAEHPKAENLRKRVAEVSLRWCFPTYVCQGILRQHAVID